MFKSLPVIKNEPSTKCIFPFVSPNLNSPEEEKNAPVPVVNVGLVPKAKVPAVESTSNLSVSNLKVGTAILTVEPDSANACVLPLKTKPPPKLKLLFESI